MGESVWEYCGGESNAAGNVWTGKLSGEAVRSRSAGDEEAIGDRDTRGVPLPSPVKRALEMRSCWMGESQPRHIPNILVSVTLLRS